jgi:hypothetical protein
MNLWKPQALCEGSAFLFVSGNALMTAKRWNTVNLKGAGKFIDNLFHGNLSSP